MRQPDIYANVIIWIVEEEEVRRGKSHIILVHYWLVHYDFLLKEQGILCIARGGVRVCEVNSAAL
jgi:hypothetical protein